MFHTAAFRTAVIGTGVNAKVEAVTDDQLSIRNNNFFLPEAMRLLYAYAGAVTLLRARLNTPTWRVVVPPQLRPFSAVILPPSPACIADYRSQPLFVPGEQELEMQVTASGGLGVAVGVIGLEVGQRINPPSRDVFTMRATSTTAAVAGAWTNVALTFDEELPPGNYHLVGLNYVATNAIAARALLSGQTWRPGCVGTATETQVGHPMFNKARLGSWGIFNNTIRPQLEVYNNSTDAVHTAWFDIVRA